MSKIRLHGSSSGYTDIAPPAAGSSATVTLPNSAGEILLSDGSAASLTQIPAASLVGVCTSGLTRTGGFGKFASYAVIADVKSEDTSGGAFTTGAWRPRDLNTEVSDSDGIVSISSNQFTLQAGTYLIEASAPAMQVDKHKIKLYNVTDSADVVSGTSSRCGNSISVQTRSEISTRFTITGAKTYEIQHQCSTTNSGVWAMGNESDFTGYTELYTIVEIYKEF